MNRNAIIVLITLLLVACLFPGLLLPAATGYVSYTPAGAVLLIAVVVLLLSNL